MLRPYKHAAPVFLVRTGTHKTRKTGHYKDKRTGLKTGHYKRGTIFRLLPGIFDIVAPTWGEERFLTFVRNDGVG